MHAPEFIKVEQFAVLADAFDAAAVIKKFKKDGAFGVQFDGDGGDKQERRKDQYSHQ